MKKILLAVIVVGLVSCENGGSVKTELDSAKTKLDTLVKKVENSAVVDSIKTKGGKLLDSVKSKGGRLIDKAGKEIGNIKKKDSTK